MRPLTTRAVVALLLLSPIAARSSGAATRDRHPGAGPLRPDSTRHPTRTVDFTTDEGTWISLDVSPDGRTIVFELLGDLYSLPIVGGEARPLRTGPTFESQPCFAPDGARLAWVSDQGGSENLWVANADGTNARRVTSEPRAAMTSPAWTADGRRLLVTVVKKGGPFIAELWEYDVGTGAGQRRIENRNGPPSLLVASAAPGVYGAHASRDGHFVYVASHVPRAYGARQGGRSSIVRLDLASGAVEPVTIAATNPMRPVPSPDGRLLAFAAQGEGKTGLRVRRLADGAEWWLRYPMDGDQLEARATRDLVPGYAFTPDGRALVVADGGNLHRIDVASGADTVIQFRAHVIMTLPAAPAGAHRLEDGPVAARFIDDLTLSSDGRMAWSAFARVWITDTSGKHRRRLTRTSEPREFQPAFSPDGQWIAFITWGSEGGYLWRTRADGAGTPQRLTTDAAFFTDLGWSPDGTRLIALRAPSASARGRFVAVPSDAEIVIVAIADGAVTRVASAAGARHPRVTGMGAAARIIAVSPQSGVVRMNLDGGNRGVLATIASAARAPDPSGMPAAVLGRVSPDGSTLLVSVADTLLRVPLPAIANPDTPPAIDLTAPQVERLSGDAPESFAWSADGAAVSWSTGTRVAVRRAATTTNVDVAIALPRVAGRGTVVLRDVRAITMKGDEVIPRADLVITDRRIVAIGARGTVTLPRNARIIELPGRTVVPGFVDLHAHGLIPGGMLEPDGTGPLANLAYGVTTLRDPQAVREIFAYSDLAEAGAMPSPRILSTGPGLFEQRNFRSLDDARRLVARYRERFGTPYLKSYLAGTREQRGWIAEAAAERDMIATTEGGADTKEDLTHALDGYAGTEHALPDVPLRRDVVQLFAQTGITYTPTLLVAFGAPFPIYRMMLEERPWANEKLRRFFPTEQLTLSSTTRLLAFRAEDERAAAQAAGAAAILRAGGHVGLGGHGELQGLQVHWEMRLLASGGMTPHEVLRVATAEGARALGLGADLGSLEPGKLADLVVLDRDPLADIRNTTSIRYVMQSGRLFDGETLDRVWPDSSALSAPWFRATTVAAERAPAARTAPTFDEAAVDAAVRREMSTQRIPGVALAIIRRGQVLMSKGYGLADIEQQVPVTDETMFQSGSLGKQMTAAGILALVEHGKLDLNASIRTYFTDAPASWQPITLRHLLSHTSGIPDYTSDAFDYRKDYSEDEMKAFAYGTTLEFRAGERWNYSNTGYVLLGILMHQASGTPYWEFLRERIFRPAGMPTVRIQSESEIVPHRARGYNVGPDGWVNQQWVAPVLNTTADGSLYFSLRDLVAWNEVVRTRTVLAKESWALALTPVTLNSGNRHPYGFGWFIDTVQGQPVHQHGGSWQGFRTQFSRYVNEDLAIVALTNSGNANPEAVAFAAAGALSPTLLRVVASAPITDPAPAAAAMVRTMLEKAQSGTLVLADFAFLRQTLFPRLTAGMGRVLAGAGPITNLELLSRRQVGDDHEVVYRVSYGARAFRVSATVAPGGGLTWLIASPVALP